MPRKRPSRREQTLRLVTEATRIARDANDDAAWFDAEHEREQLRDSYKVVAREVVAALGIPVATAANGGIFEVGGRYLEHEDLGPMHAAVNARLNSLADVSRPDVHGTDIEDKPDVRRYLRAREAGHKHADAILIAVVGALGRDAAVEAIQLKRTKPIDRLRKDLERNEVQQRWLRDVRREEQDLRRVEELIEMHVAPSASEQMQRLRDRLAHLRALIDSATTK